MSDSTEEPHSKARMRVGKACDRCRLKKSKCDGQSPCNRCKADNAICIFGRRVRSIQDKVYPKGYTHMLEKQQGQLITGLRLLYHRLQTGEGWPGPPLREAEDGHPLTHDILERLEILDPYGNNNTFQGLEEICDKVVQKILARQRVSMRHQKSAVADFNNEVSSAPQSPASSTNSGATSPIESPSVSQLRIAPFPKSNTTFEPPNTIPSHLVLGSELRAVREPYDFNSNNLRETSPTKSPPTYQSQSAPYYTSNTTYEPEHNTPSHPSLGSESMHAGPPVNFTSNVRYECGPFEYNMESMIGNPGHENTGWIDPSGLISGYLHPQYIYS